jgi:hypothetical protein
MEREKGIIVRIRESHQGLRALSLLEIGGHWFHIIVLNVHALTVENIDDVKDRSYEELEVYLIKR